MSFEISRATASALAVPEKKVQMSKRLANYIKEVPTMDIIEKPVRRIDVPIAQKANLSLHEAAAYFNIGEKKLRQLIEGDRCPFVLYCGSKRLI